MSDASKAAVVEKHVTPDDAIRKLEFLPQHDDISLASRVFYFGCIVAAGVLLVVNVVRIQEVLDVFPLWLPFVALAGMVAADFVSGLVHWTADTWGRISMPILGRRFLHPFRVHHVNPHDFLRRRVLETNGDTAMLVTPFLALTLFIPLGTLGPLVAAVFLTALCSVVLPTNQVHQWAHMPNPPGMVKPLQNFGIILSRQAHGRHHSPPHVHNYCIALGWCNATLTAVDFWRRLEQLVSSTTGIEPRADEARFVSESEELMNRRIMGRQCDA
ncbi:MAG: fatty acid desaturase CarF family protein [Fuerstiella sp.]|nr:carotenoid synthesis regulator CarF [Fuerstiella sp.]